MSSCYMENRPALETYESAVAAWRRGARGVLDSTLGRLAAWRTRQRFRRDVRGLSDRLLRDVGLEVEGRRAQRETFWRGHLPR